MVDYETTFPIFVFFCLIISTTSAFSQTNIRLKDSNYARLEHDRWDLERYLWTYAKNKVVKHDKSIVDFNTIENWPKLGDYLSISRNGKYFAYTIERGCSPFEQKGELDSLIVQSIDNPWRLAVFKATPGFFTDDNKYYILQEGTSLSFLQLGAGQSKYVENVRSYKVQEKDKKEWLAYQLNVDDSKVVLQNLVTEKKKLFFGISNYEFDKSNEWLVCQRNSTNGVLKELLLYQLTTGMEKRYFSVVEYWIAENGKALLLKTVEKIGEGTVTSIEYVSLPGGVVKRIWSTTGVDAKINNCSMDKLGRQVVFSVRDSLYFTAAGMINNSIWYYRKGMDKAILKVANGTIGIEEGLQIEGSASFTDNDRYIKFSLQRRPRPGRKDPDAVQLDVWSHKDIILQSTQSYLLEHPQLYNSIINTENGRITRLESEGRTLHWLQGDFAIVKKLRKDIYGDRFWEKGYGCNGDSNWLVDLNDGSSHLLGDSDGNVVAIGPFWFSPGGNYLVYFDFDKKCHYFSYNLRTGKVTNISSDVDGNRLGYINPYMRTVEKPKYPLGIAAWLERDAGVLIYDNNDVWQFDLQGREPAINLTNGLGRSDDIIFSLFNSQRFDIAAPILDQSEPLLLRAFNVKSKYSGFYRKVIDAAGDPELLYMGKYFMDMIPWCQDPNLSNKGLPPIKASEVNTWIVQRQSDNDAPNYYKTTDFKSFERLTDIQPQQGFNWLFEELHSFKHLNGREGEGILYKPEDFDSSKKYPVLIVFYGGFSNNLYQFPLPVFNVHAITPGMSPIWFLNNGYLIFTPDIYVTPLVYGPEAFNVIEGAVQYLKQLPYVDAIKIGCCSHSWSAKLGAYIFTHSKSFSATAISEGFVYANMINVALSTDEDGVSRLEEVEQAFQYGNLWENKDYWIDQTTVLNINMSKSPLLLLCNKKSDEEYKNQTLQLFTALRRLEKEVWWLEYEKGGHIVYNLQERKDYTIRYTQFFDHYLKEAPAPCWMTKGIRAAMKSIETGYELDPAGNCGAKENKCKVCEMWNEQYRKTPEMFNKPISEWHLDQTAKQ